MLQITTLASRELSQASDILRGEGLGPFRLAQVTAGTVKHLGRLLHLSKSTNLRILPNYCESTSQSPKQTKLHICRSRSENPDWHGTEKKSSQACCCKSALTTLHPPNVLKGCLSGKYSGRCQNAALSATKR